MGTSESDPVALALRTAIDRKDGVEVRVALASRLLEKGDAETALAEFEAALEMDAADPSALEGAVRAAEQLGDVTRAYAYRLALRTGGASTEADSEGEEPADQEVLGSRPVPTRGHLRLAAENGELLNDDAEPTLRFEDVGGLEDVKVRLERAFIRPLRQPELYQKFGKRIGGGLVLYGPPGCGKTHIGRAVAGEVGARFVNVGLTDVLDMYIGESERRLHEVFENARRRAPTLLFFDELDALGQRRTQLKHSALRPVVNQLLAELDGFGGQQDEVFVLAATNHPWDLDPAIRRPGRFDRLLFVPPPDRPARERILKLKLAGRPMADGLSLDQVARATDGLTGADLAALVDAATELAIERSMDENREVPIDQKMLDKARGDTRASARPWLETARNYAVYANEGGSYDELLEYLQRVGMA